MKKVAIHNLGCKVNSYEAEAMEQLLSDAGYQIVPFDEKIVADVYIINTCSVTNIADRKSRQMLHKAKKLNPDAVVVAAGCYAQSDDDKLSKDSAVDIILGNNCKINIVEALNNYYNGNPDNIELHDMSEEHDYEELSISRVNEHTRAYIKIQDGCNQFCSYCIIPYLRGRIRSRDISDIKREVIKLTKSGYKEFVLTGIHISSYGLDTGKEKLIDVIEMLNEINGVERIRLGSLEPRIITEEFVKRLSVLNKICPHFHLSLQSGCDKTLKRMNRKYSTEEYLNSCSILRKYFDCPAITTDVIVGFPGETEDDFNITREFLKEVHFYEMHIFKYSRRKGTAADKMPDQIDEKIKTQRSKVLLNLEKEMSLEYRRSFIGKTLEVLIEEKCTFQDKEYYSGYSKNYIRILLPENQIISGGNITDNNPINQIIKVKCMELKDNTMMICDIC